MTTPSPNHNEISEEIRKLIIKNAVYEGLPLKEVAK
jgi:hypothetical protein